MEVVWALLQAQAAVNQAKNDGVTPLLIASQYGHLKIVQALLHAGVSANYESNMVHRCALQKGRGTVQSWRPWKTP